MKYGNDDPLNGLPFVDELPDPLRDPRTLAAFLDEHMQRLQQLQEEQSALLQARRWRPLRAGGSAAASAFGGLQALALWAEDGPLWLALAALVMFACAGLVAHVGLGELRLRSDIRHGLQDMAELREWLGAQRARLEAMP